MTPALSENQQKAMAIAEHEPEKLYERNKDMLGMTKEELHHFSTTKTRNLPKRRAKKRSLLCHK